MARAFHNLAGLVRDLTAARAADARSEGAELFHSFCLLIDDIVDEEPEGDSIDQPDDEAADGWDGDAASDDVGARRPDAVHGPHDLGRPGPAPGGLDDRVVRSGNADAHPPQHLAGAHGLSTEEMLLELKLRGIEEGREKLNRGRHASR